MPTTTDTEAKEQCLAKLSRHENIRMIKNVVVLGVAFMVHFTAFHGTANLQSSINPEAAMGTYTLAAMYGSLILSNIFLPVIVIRWLGCKWTIALSFMAYIPFIAAQFFPRFYTLLPAGLFVGFGGGPLWCAKCTYLTIIAEAYVSFTGNKQKVENVVVRFFGLFFVFYQMAQVWGNLVSSTVLSQLKGDDQSSAVTNLSALYVRDVGEICGANFCPGLSANDNPNLQPPDEKSIRILMGIFLACMVFACALVAVGVNSLKRYDMGRKGAGSEVSGIKLLAITVKQLGHRYQLLLLPITMFVGAEQAFVAVDFTAAFVACGWGISHIGYAMICFGLANALAAALAGALTKITGRIPVMFAVLILHASLIIWMIQWRAVEKDYVSYCTFAALWGMADGIWLVQVNAASGILFPGQEEAAFSNFRLWEATGSVITYSLSPLLCTSIKLHAILALMFVGMVCFCVIELLEYKVKKGLNRQQFELVDKETKEQTQQVK